MVAIKQVIFLVIVCTISVGQYCYPESVLIDYPDAVGNFLLR